MTVPIDVSMGDGSIKIAVEDHDLAGDATLYMVIFQKSETVDIKRGENAGKQLTYHNIVHDTEVLGMVKAGGLEMEFPVAELKRRGFDSCALILQTNDKSGNPTAIVGAAVISDI